METTINQDLFQDLTIRKAAKAFGIRPTNIQSVERHVHFVRVSMKNRQTFQGPLHVSVATYVDIYIPSLEFYSDKPLNSIQVGKAWKSPIQRTQFEYEVLLNEFNHAEIEALDAAEKKQLVRDILENMNAPE